MHKCRLCIKQRKKLRSVFGDTDGTTFVDMITSIAHVKIQKNDGFTDKICFTCCKKLREAYEFKISIERSDSILHETNNFKKISFNNLEDIKIKIEIDTDCKPIIPSFDFFSENLLKDGEKCISYKDTFIKKVKIDNTEDQKKESLSVMEFLKTIKAEPDNDFDYEIEMDNHNLDDDSDYEPPNILEEKRTGKEFESSGDDSDYEPPNMKKEKKKRTGKEFKRSDGTYLKNKKCKSDDLIICPPTPIKPVYLEDIRHISLKFKNEMKPNRIKKNASRKGTKSVCPYCGKITKTGTMNTHILIHIGERKFKCEICSKGFFTLSTLTAHSKKHSEAVYKCELCVATFNMKTSLRSHMLMHTAEKSHVCDICSKAFKRKTALQRHLKIHNFGIKSIQCELCSMSFHSNVGLRHHLRVHTGERPYKCEICSQPYSYKHDFNRHCFKKHGIFLKRRSVYVMNEEVLKRERELMRDLMLRAHGILREGEPINPFEGPQAALAFEQAIKAIEAKQIPIDFQF